MCLKYLDMDVQGYLNSGGRIAHIREPNDRVVSIAYSRDYENGLVRYGATIYRPGGEAWNRRMSNQLSILRATQFPVAIEDNPEWTGLERKQAIRKAMLTNGVSSR